jgi:hypothetical protein
MTYDDIPLHRDYIAFQSRWLQLKHCLEGEEAVKAERERYLPYPVRVDDEDKNSKEYQAMYELFLQGAHFVEFTAEAVEDLVSSAFRRPLELKRNAEVVTEIEELDYIDFADVGKEVVSAVGAYGRVFLLVDYPSIETVPNMIEDQNNKAYITLYPPLDVLNWRETKRSGKVELVRVVLREIDEVAIAKSEDAETGTADVKYMYRELIIEDGIYKIKIYREDQDVKTIIPLANGEYLTEIPGLFIGTTSNTARVDKSPVMGISNSNIKHYQTWAELLYLQTYVGHPQLVLTGLTPGWNKQAEKQQFKVKMDAAEILALEGDSSAAQILEIDTKQLIHFKTLEVLESSMAEQGARIKAISHKAGVESAEALKIRTSASMSKLASIVQNASEGLTEALKWLGAYMGEDLDAYSISINKEFYSPNPDGPFLTSISNAEVAGTAPRGTALNYLKQVELVDDNIPNEVYLKDMVLATEQVPMPNKQQGGTTQINKIPGSAPIPAKNKN